MKKFNKVVCLLLVMLLCFSPIGFTSKAEAVSPKPIVSAHAYIVMDAKSGKILYSQNPDKKIYPASTVKLMTALIAIEKCSLSKKITVKQSVLSKLPSDATKAGLKAGYTYTLEELLNMLLVYSAADAASTIADAVAGSTSEFVKLMNQRAKSLGMNSTSFDNPIGLDGTRFPNTYSTANDITKLTRYTMKNTTIRNIVAKPSYTIKNFYNGSSKTLNCTNKFLRGQWYPKDLYKIIGTKTGTTNAAGYVLSTTAIDSKGREFICAFFGNATRVKMYENIEALLTYTYKNLSSNYGWCQTGGKWYYYDNLGVTKKGWLKYNEKWYYLKSNGEMATGWTKYNGAWYYLKSNGEMATNTTINSYNIDSNGVAIPIK